jgi:hypothetical protein
MTQTPGNDPDELSFPASWKSQPPALADPASGPTTVDRTAGITALNQAYGAALLRKLATRHLGEMDHAHLPLIGNESVSIVATDEVQAWLEGMAIRVENGALD